MGFVALDDVTDRKRRHNMFPGHDFLLTFSSYLASIYYRSYVLGVSSGVVNSGLWSAAAMGCIRPNATILYFPSIVHLSEVIGVFHSDVRERRIPEMTSPVDSLTRIMCRWPYEIFRPSFYR
jgi:hypothetical protein